MKTIIQARLDANDCILPKSKYEFDRGFDKGIEFAQRWIPIEEEFPLSIEFGEWDGLRSEFVIAKCSDGDWYKARTYAGIMDGHEFCDWYDERDFELSNVVSWRPIERQ